MPQQIAQVDLDANGDGTIRLDPAPYHRWIRYTTVAVSIDTGTTSAATGGEARLYKGEPSPGNFLTGTRTPWLDTATFGGFQARLTHPDYLSIQFTNCDPAGVATIVATFHYE